MHNKSGLAAIKDGDSHKVTVEVAPRQSKRVIIGVFEEGINIPDYSIEYSPKMTDAISYKRIVAAKDDENILSFYFTNFSDVTISILLTEKDV